MLQQNLLSRSRFNQDIDPGEGDWVNVVLGPDCALVDQLICEPETTFVLYGLGDGKLAIEIARRLREDCALLVVELDDVCLRSAFMQCDLTPMLAHERVKLIGPNQDIFAWLYHRILRASGRVQVIIPRSLLERDSRYKDVHENKVLYLLRLLSTSTNTVEAWGRLIIDNIGRTLKLIGSSSGVLGLSGLFDGVPCILVGSGPSLNGSEEHLLSAERTAVIVAADSTIGWLLDRGIVPDFVTSVDPQETTYTKYDGIEIPETVSLVYNPACYWKIPTNFGGMRFVTDISMALYVAFSKYWNTKGTIEDSAHCQLHLGFNLARLMGCSEIAFVGNDLSYPGNRFCATGGRGYMAAYQDTEVNGVLGYDVNGGPVLTTPLFLSYRDVFEWMVERFGRSVYQTSQVGLNIRGTISESLETVVSRWARLTGNKTKQIRTVWEKFDNHFDEIGIDKRIFGLRKRLTKLTECAVKKASLDGFYEELSLLPVSRGNYDQLATLAWTLCEALGNVNSVVRDSKSAGNLTGW